MTCRTTAARGGLNQQAGLEAARGAAVADDSAAVALAGLSQASLVRVSQTRLEANHGL